MKRNENENISVFPSNRGRGSGMKKTGGMATYRI